MASSFYLVLPVCVFQGCSQVAPFCHYEINRARGEHTSSQRARWTNEVNFISFLLLPFFNSTSAESINSNVTLLRMSLVVSVHFRPLQNSVRLPEDAVSGSGCGSLSSSKLCQTVPRTLPHAHRQYNSTSAQVGRFKSSLSHLSPKTYWHQNGELLCTFVFISYAPSVYIVTITNSCLAVFMGEFMQSWASRPSVPKVIISSSGGSMVPWTRFPFGVPHNQKYIFIEYVYPICTLQKNNKT